MFVGTMNLGALGGAVPYSAIVPAFLKHTRWTLAAYAPDKLPFTAQQISAWLAVGPQDFVKAQQYSNDIEKIVNAYKSAPVDPEVIRQVAGILKASDADAEKAIRKHRSDIAHTYDSGATLETFLKIAAFAVAGAWLATATVPAAAGGGGGFSTGGGAGFTAGTTGGGLSPWAGSVLGVQPAGIGASLGTGIVASGGSSAIAATALAALKKYAIDYGVEYAMGKAAEYYATQQQKKMEAAQEKALRDELAAAKAEYEKLTAAGATPEAAASQAVAKPDTIPVAVIAGVALLALLILRK